MNRLTHIIKDKYIIRHTKKQKAEFRNFIVEELKKDGFDVRIQSGKVTGIPVHNIIIGNTGSAKYLITAHYDTPNTCLIPLFMFADSFILSLLSQMAVFIPIVLLSFLAGIIHPVLVMPVLYAGMILGILTFTNKNNFNDNTSGVLGVLETLYSMSDAERKDCAFILFDNEEKGLLGSSYFYKNTVNKTSLIFNIDCIGDGDEIRLFTKGGGISAGEEMAGSFGGENILSAKAVKRSVRNVLYMSDDNNFPNAICFAAFRTSPFGKYISRIHTNLDTVLKDENILAVSQMIRNYVFTHKQG